MQSKINSSAKKKVYNRNLDKIEELSIEDEEESKNSGLRFSKMSVSGSVKVEFPAKSHQDYFKCK